MLLFCFETWIACTVQGHLLLPFHWFTAAFQNVSTIAIVDMGICTTNLHYYYLQSPSVPQEKSPSLQSYLSQRLWRTKQEERLGVLWFFLGKYCHMHQQAAGLQDVFEYLNSDSPHVSHFNNVYSKSFAPILDFYSLLPCRRIPKRGTMPLFVIRKHCQHFIFREHQITYWSPCKRLVWHYLQMIIVRSAMLVF